MQSVSQSATPRTASLARPRRPALAKRSQRHAARRSSSVQPEHGVARSRHEALPLAEPPPARDHAAARHVTVAQRAGKRRGVAEPRRVERQVDHGRQQQAQPRFQRKNAPTNPAASVAPPTARRLVPERRRAPQRRAAVLANALVLPHQRAARRRHARGKAARAARRAAHHAPAETDPPTRHQHPQQRI